MAEFAQQLLIARPKEAARVFAPLVALFEEILEEAAAEGAVRTGLRRGPIVGDGTRSDHVQHVLIDDRRPVRSAR